MLQVKELYIKNRRRYEKEVQKIEDALMAEGIALENLLSALISMSYKNELIDIEDDEVKK